MAAKKQTRKKTAAKKTATKTARPKAPASKTAKTGARPAKKATRKRTAASARRAPVKKGNGLARRDQTARATARDLAREAIAEGRKVYLLDVPYEERKTAIYGGATYSAGLRTFVYITRPGHTDLPAALAPYAAPSLSLQAWLQDDLNGTETVIPASGTITPRSHQHEAIDAITAAWRAGRSGFVLADDVGSGKTVESILGILALPGDGPKPVRNVLISAPAPIAAQWRLMLTLTGTIGTDGINKRFCVISMDSVRSKLLAIPESVEEIKTTTTKRGKAAVRKRQADEGEPIIRFDLVVIDEAHKVRNPTTERARSHANLTRARSKTPAWSMYLSATTGTTPADVIYLAPLMAEATGTRIDSTEALLDWYSLQGISVRKGAYGVLEWAADDPAERARQIDLVRGLLFEGPNAIGLRRGRDKFGWTEPPRGLLPMPLAVEERRLYDTAWDEFAHELRALRRGQPRGQRAKTTEALINTAAGRAAQMRYQQKASQLRVGQGVAWIVEQLDAGAQVAVSVQWRETLDLLASELARKGLDPAIMHGGLSTGAKEAERLAFQRGRKSVALFTVVEGISLHEGDSTVGGNEVPRTMLMYDPRWTPIQLIQIEGRINRDGRYGPVHYAYGEGTREALVLERVFGRVCDLRRMHGDDELDFFTDLDALILDAPAARAA